jgi:hypothetical protein
MLLNCAFFVVGMEAEEELVVPSPSLWTQFTTRDHADLDALSSSFRSSDLQKLQAQPRGGATPAEIAAFVHLQLDSIGHDHSIIDGLEILGAGCHERQQGGVLVQCFNEAVLRRQAVHTATVTHISCWSTPSWIVVHANSQVCIGCIQRSIWHLSSHRSP